MRKYLLLSSFLLITSAAHAGITIGGTRVVYPENKKESSIGIANPDNLDYLVQSWVETEDNAREKAPFLITPPLFRLDAKQDNVLRIIRTGGNLPADRESLFWLNIKSIPSSARNENTNTLQIAIKTRIKLLYRPASITGKPEDATTQLTWHTQGNQLIVENPTPFYMNFQEIKLDGKKVDKATYAKPKAETHFSVPGNITARSVSWKIINDYGGISQSYTAQIK
ncbi:long polar fimbrial chaperone LpfB [Enterobacter genomosp. O]|uniref:fimbrial biogenesis chaperone n=1 Tax=Enterobacter genomosp. O TaxID=2364150 RepID=UPI0006438256|nr:molecular chaperone [Enterobacter genomosp. O]KLP55482.1 long polar fimbrial chaperone LpfB [Enterobacter genomosp. O]MCW1825902.1 molecular chaperone [Enterobacter asburiae]